MFQTLTGCCGYCSAAAAPAEHNSVSDTPVARRQRLQTETDGSRLSLSSAPPPASVRVDMLLCIYMPVIDGSLSDCRYHLSPLVPVSTHIHTRTPDLITSKYVHVSELRDCSYLQRPRQLPWSNGRTQTVSVGRVYTPAPTVPFCEARMAATAIDLSTATTRLVKRRGCHLLAAERERLKSSSGASACRQARMARC